MVKASKKTAPVSDFQRVVAKMREEEKMPVNPEGIPVPVRVTVHVSELLGTGNPLNWKKHNERQNEYVRDSIANKGWARSILFNANTMRLIDGHGRLELGESGKLTWFEVDVGWWSEDDEKELLASLDPTSGMASIDGSALSSLTQSILKGINERKGKKKPLIAMGMFTDVNTFANQILENKKASITIEKSKRKVEVIDGRLVQVNDDEEIEEDEDIEDEEEIEEDDDLVAEVILDDVEFPSSNEFGIPDLDPKMMYRNLKLLPDRTFTRKLSSISPTTYYCTSCRPFDNTAHTKVAGGFLGFYTEDYRFEKYYTQAATWVERLIGEEWTAVCEPDYSTYYTWPFAKRLWSVYRARWLMRYWQKFQIKTIPILHRTRNVEQDRAWLYDTLPECPVMITQVRMGGLGVKNDKEYWSMTEEAMHFAVENLGLKMLLLHMSMKWLKYVEGLIPRGLKYKVIVPFIDARRDEQYHMRKARRGTSHKEDTVKRDRSKREFS